MSCPACCPSSSTPRRSPRPGGRCRPRGRGARSLLASRRYRRTSGSRSHRSRGWMRAAASLTPLRRRASASHDRRSRNRRAPSSAREEGGDDRLLWRRRRAARGPRSGCRPASRSARGRPGRSGGCSGEAMRLIDDLRVKAGRPLPTNAKHGGCSRLTSCAFGFQSPMLRPLLRITNARHRVRPFVERLPRVRSRGYGEMFLRIQMRDVIDQECEHRACKQSVM